MSVVESNIKEFKVRSDADVKKLGSAIYLKAIEGFEIMLSAMGAQSINQALKASVIAGEKFASIGETLYLRPAFAHLELLEDDPNYATENGKTYMRFYVKRIVGA